MTSVPGRSFTQFFHYDDNVNEKLFCKLDHFIATKKMFVTMKWSSLDMFIFFKILSF